MPTDLLDAITHARTVMSWYEHLPEEEIPPRWMWHLDEEVEEFFERQKEKRRTGHDNDDDDDGGPMLKNEYARGRGRGAR